MWHDIEALEERTKKYTQSNEEKTKFLNRVIEEMDWLEYGNEKDIYEDIAVCTVFDVAQEMNFAIDPKDIYVIIAITHVIIKFRKLERYRNIRNTGQFVGLMPQYELVVEDWLK